MIKKIFSNTFYQLIGKVFTMLVTVVVTVIIARAYGREAFGYFNLMQTWPALVYVVIDFGFNAIATREITKDPKKSSAYLSTILVLRFWMSAAAILVISLLLQFMPYSDELKSGIRLNLLLILTQGLYASTTVIFQPNFRYDLAALGSILGYVYTLVSITVMAYFKFPVALLSFNYVLGGVLTFILNLFSIKKMGISVGFKLDKLLAKDLK